MFVSAIVVAAGKAKRFKGRASKVISKLNRIPVICYSLKVLNGNPGINEIIVVGNKHNFNVLSDIIRRYKFSKVAGVVLGGKERQDSVRNGIGSVNEKADFVLIHDAARPFITAKLVSSVINAAKESGAAIVGMPVKDTIKEVVSSKSYVVSKTLKRDLLWEIQTPQVFRKEIILKAYGKFGNLKVTDDAMLVEKLGKKVSIVLGSYNNIKITTPEDFIIAGAIVKAVVSSKL